MSGPTNPSSPHLSVEGDSQTASPHMGYLEAPLAVEASIQHGRSMKQVLFLLAFGLLVPSAALAREGSNVAAKCQDARDFYGCVRAFTTPAQRSDDIAPLAGVMGQVAAGLISSPTYLIGQTNVSQVMNPAGLVEGILRAVLR